MNKNNFFNFKQNNIWDNGWPCSPRLFTVSVGIPMLIFFGYLLCYC